MTTETLTGPPVAGSEADTLIGALERNRRTFAWKCGGLDAAGSRARLAPSSMTLGGLLKHLALVEDDMFTSALLGRPMPEPWAGVDFEADPDWEWRTGAADDPAEVLALWEAAVARSRAAVAEALGRRRPRPARRADAVDRARRACAGSWSTWSRSTPGTPATPT